MKKLIKLKLNKCVDLLCGDDDSNLTCVLLGKGCSL